MKQILSQIQSGEFAREWILENRAGRPVFQALDQRDRNHAIERVGRELRAMMSWVNSDSAPETTAADSTPATEARAELRR